MMLGARTAAWAKSGPNPIWRVPTKVRSQSPALTPTTPLMNPPLDDTVFASYNVGYGYGSYFQIDLISDGFSMTRKGGNQNYAVGEFCELKPETEYRIKWNAEGDYRDMVITSLQSSDEGGWLYRANILSYAGDLRDRVFKTPNLEGLLFFVGFRMSATVGAVCTITGVSITEES